jgi:hypothetical protein
MLDVKHYETVQKFYTEFKTDQSKETLPTSTISSQKFKIEDIVELTKDYDDLTKGMQGVVKHFVEDHSVGVQWNNFVGKGHKLNGILSVDNGYYVKKSNLILVESLKEPMKTTIPSQRFKIGDTVTYKSKEECNCYHYGGEDQKGFKGRIVNYGRFNAEKNCFIIGVTSNESCDYNMLESEFYEYDQIPLPQEPTNKTLLYTIKDRVLRFNGHEVRVGDTVSYDCEYLKKKFQTVTKIERDGYCENYPFVVGGDWDNINNISNFVNHGQPNSKEPFKQPLKFKVYEKVLFITFKKGESGTIIKVDEEEEYFKYYVRLSSDNNICVCGEKDIISYSREEERALTMDEHLDSLTKFYSSGLIVEDSEIKLTIPLIKKSVSDYQQKPVTLYKSKNKLSLKPINLTK